jgi:hypothetical protein
MTDKNCQVKSQVRFLLTNVLLTSRFINLEKERFLLDNPTTSAVNRSQSTQGLIGMKSSLHKVLDVVKVRSTYELTVGKVPRSTTNVRGYSQRTSFGVGQKSEDKGRQTI